MIIKVIDEYINLDQIHQVTKTDNSLLSIRYKNHVDLMSGEKADFLLGVLDALHAITVKSINEKLPQQSQK